MKLVSLGLLLFFSSSAFSQKKDFSIYNLSLPAEIADPNNQFSGLFINNDHLFLLSESRLQDSAEAKLYAIKLADLEHKMIDSSFILPFRKYPICNLELLRSKMKLKGDDYEGLEAIVINENMVYFSVETTTPSDNCYLLKGNINDTAVIVDDNFLIPMPKPVLPDGKHVYNAGFEALALFNKDVYTAFFEYNYFPGQNVVRWLTQWSFKNNGIYHPLSIDKLPFRITDITTTNKKIFTALNFFYKGSGKDEIYRVAAGDRNESFIKDSSGYRNYCRLVEVKYRNAKFKWKSIWEFPKEYSGYNWEGIASYKKGYFIINDKYTPEKPYKTFLLYLKPR